jgi:hypothetical protein
MPLLLFMPFQNREDGKAKETSKQRKQASKYHQRYYRDSIRQEEYPVRFVTYKIQPTKTSKRR